MADTRGWREPTRGSWWVEERRPDRGARAWAVVDALSTHRVYLSDKPVGWCTSAETFQDPHHGSEWGPRGDYMTGPAPTGLATYAARVEGSRVHVGARQPPTARGEGTPTERAGPSCVWPEVRHTAEDAPWPTVTPEQTADRDGPVVVSGTIINHSDGSARMCSQPSVGPRRVARRTAPT